MRGVKCFGLLLVFSIIFGFSLSASSDVSALKYAYNAYPLYSNIVARQDLAGGFSDIVSNPLFQVSFVSSSSISYDLSLTDPSISGFYYCGSNNPTHDSIFYSNFYNNSFSFSSATYFSKLAFSNNSSRPCWSQIPSSSWDYDSFYSAEYNLSTGEPVKLVSLNDMFFDSDDPSYSSGSLKFLGVPLTLDSDRFSKIDSGTLLEWDFGLVAESPGFPYLSDSFTSSLTIKYSTSSPSDFDSFYNSWTSRSVSCSIDDSYGFGINNGDLTIIPYFGFNVHCSFTAPSDMYFVHPYLSLSSSDRILDYNNSGIWFTGSYFITGGDDTWSGDFANAQPTGDNIENAPGYYQLYGDSSSVSCSPNDWFCELTNSFSFNFINPFAPIFNLFSDQNSCAQIPTLAGMLHSEETQVCPWFDSTTRNIVTPVLGLSSMMLLFGFAVRWLGARSGNFIEDSGGIDSGGLHFQNKFRRGKD